MKVTLEPTLKSTHQFKVTVETPFDDLDINAMMGIIESALKAFGYHQSTIDDYWDRTEVVTGDE